MSVLQAALPHLQRLTRLLAKAPGGPGTRQELDVAAREFLSAVPGREGPWAAAGHRGGGKALHQVWQALADGQLMLSAAHRRARATHAEIAVCSPSMLWQGCD